MKKNILYGSVAGLAAWEVSRLLAAEPALASARRPDGVSAVLAALFAIKRNRTEVAALLRRRGANAEQAARGVEESR